ncbi:hypothetical protein SASPL_107808 [Salvia splendens]|uniref:Xyloglucan 6-xylosyltransferase n=1 Tax=Salvia splendens TaxID=180675 RepID=A0A8X8YGX3_SALSN|nr:probable xyloglucan 6-xylosyltransferase 3 [Salvia splendens]KAG6429755.1 hypothetical protein SASPL_107808 [Salvia splendens]
MAIEGVSASASASASTTRGGRRRHQGGQRSRNLKLTILSGVVTLLIFRSTIDSSLHSSLPDISTTNYVEEANRFIAQIRSNKEDEDGNSTTLITPNQTYTLGPKITNWDGQRQMFLQKHPSFSSKNPRIMLVTGSRQTPCDSTIGDHYLLKSIKNKIDYCRLHSIEIVYNMAFFDEVMSGVWVKLPLIRKLMLSHPEMEWIWWMDSDAFFTDMFFEVPFYRYEGYNMVVHGYPNLLFDEKSWIALSAGVFLLRNCQWSLDLLDAWARMGPRGWARDEAGRILTQNLKGRPAFEADDQSALIYLLISRRDEWMDRVFLENSYYLHGYWVGLVDRYEEYERKFHPGLGDERWPFITHFIGCKVCTGYGDYTFESCLRNMERAFNFADDQMLEKYGFRHRGLSSPNVKRIRNETSRPLEHTDKINVSQTVYI